MDADGSCRPRPVRRARWPASPTSSSAIADRADGRLPDERFHDLLYADLVADPVAAIRRAYGQFGWAVDDTFAETITRYLTDKPKGAKGTHVYHPGDFGLTAAGIRRTFADYLDRFAIPPED
ncbi:MAG: hypothetical protein R2695_16935 [Acidimicrobiales bacterium]